MVDAHLEKVVADIKDLPKDRRAQIAIIGKSNVGKSSFFNYLFRSADSYVSKKAGKTKTLNFFLTTDNYYIVDTPGIGFVFNKREKLTDLVENYLNFCQDIKGVIVIVDVRHPYDDTLSSLLKDLEKLKIKTLIIGNKVDKISYNETMRFCALSKNLFPFFDVITGSSKTEQFSQSVISLINQMLK